MLDVSLTTVNLSALPLLSVSSRIVTLSVGFRSKVGKGYSKDCVTHILPFASKVMFMGLSMSGSEAKRVISKPSGTMKPARSSSGVRGSVGRMFSAKFGPLVLLSSRGVSLQPKRTVRSSGRSTLFIGLRKFFRENRQKPGTRLWFFLFEKRPDPAQNSNGEN